MKKNAIKSGTKQQLRGEVEDKILDYLQDCELNDYNVDYKRIAGIVLAVLESWYGV